MRILLIDLVIFLKNTDLACYYMIVTLFYDKLYEKNMKNLQTKIYSALFSDFEYLAPLQSNEIFFRVSSEKTYCTSFFLCQNQLLPFPLKLELQKTLVIFYSTEALGCASVEKFLT